MDKNDYLGSFAEENVVFQTRVVKTTSVGDNYMKTMIFITAASLTADGQAALVLVPGSTTVKALSVTSEDFASATTGLLQSWLVDLFANGNIYDAILVVVGDGTAAPDADALAEAYDVVKPYAFHKTLCIGTGTDAPATNADVSPTLMAKLADLCMVDKDILSSAVLAPYSVFAVPTGTGDDPLYAALKGKYAFMSCHTDTTRNAALYSLGLALGIINGSGTPIGNPMCRPSSSNITQSDAAGLNSKTVRSALNALFIQTFKAVGDNSGAVCAEVELCLNGDAYAANWIKAYVAYMTKVGVARLITGTNNFWKIEGSYNQILGVLRNYLNLFGSTGSGRLKDLSITAPAFGALPESAADELIIPNAWVATYIGVVNKVTITGTMYIEV